MRDAGRVNKFLVKARGSWQRRWSRGTRGSRSCQAPADERQEHIAIQRTKWCMACVPVQVVLCQIHWWKNFITTVSQHGLWPNVGFRGFSPVPQIMEEIMDDMQLVPQGRVQDRIVAQLIASSVKQIMEDVIVVVVQLVPQWRIWNSLCSYLRAEGLKAGETMDLFQLSEGRWRSTL